MIFKTAHPEHADPASAVRAPAPALRCDCGALLVRLVAAGIELKCRRCKRVVVLELDALRSGRVFAV